MQGRSQHDVKSGRRSLSFGVWLCLALIALIALMLCNPAAAQLPPRLVLVPRVDGISPSRLVAVNTLQPLELRGANFPPNAVVETRWSGQGWTATRQRPAVIGPNLIRVEINTTEQPDPSWAVRVVNPSQPPLFSNEFRFVVDAAPSSQARQPVQPPLVQPAPAGALRSPPNPEAQMEPLRQDQQRKMEAERQRQTQAEQQRQQHEQQRQGLLNGISDLERALATLPAGSPREQAFRETAAARSATQAGQLDEAQARVTTAKRALQVIQASETQRAAAPVQPPVAAPPAGDVPLRRSPVPSPAATAAPVSAPSAPQIRNVSPDTLTAREGGQPLTLHGSDFRSGLSVTVMTEGGRFRKILSPDQVTVNNPRQITLQINTTPQPDNWQAFVTNPDGRHSNVAGFRVVAAQPLTQPQGQSPVSLEPANTLDASRPIALPPTVSAGSRVTPPDNVQRRATPRGGSPQALTEQQRQEDLLRIGEDMAREILKLSNSAMRSGIEEALGVAVSGLIVEIGKHLPKEVADKILMNPRGVINWAAKITHKEGLKGLSKVDPVGFAIGVASEAVVEFIRESWPGNSTFLNNLGMEMLVLAVRETKVAYAFGRSGIHGAIAAQSVVSANTAIEALQAGVGLMKDVKDAREAQARAAIGERFIRLRADFKSSSDRATKQNILRQINSFLAGEGSFLIGGPDPQTLREKYICDLARIGQVSCDIGLSKPVSVLSGVSNSQSTATQVPASVSVLASPAASPGEATLVRIIDGDTLEVIYEGKPQQVRVMNVDTPEVVDGEKLSYDSREWRIPKEQVVAMGRQATEFTARRVPMGSRVFLEFEGARLDKYNRLLSYVYLDAARKVMLNAELVRNGYARYVPRDWESGKEFEQKRYGALFQRLESDAKARRVGLWSIWLGTTSSPVAPGQAPVPPVPTTQSFGPLNLTQDTDILGSDGRERRAEKGQTLIAGERVTIRTRVCAQGGDAASGRVKNGQETDTAFLVLEGNGGWREFAKSQTRDTTLRKGNCENEKATFTVPHAPGQRICFRAVIDAANEINESAEHDNQSRDECFAIASPAAPVLAPMPGVQPPGVQPPQAMPAAGQTTPPSLSITRFEDAKGCCTTNTGDPIRPRIWVRNNGGQPTGNVIVRYQIASAVTGGQWIDMGPGTIEPRELIPGDTDEDRMDNNDGWRIPKDRAWINQWHTVRACVHRQGASPTCNPATDAIAEYTRASKK